MAGGSSNMSDPNPGFFNHEDQILPVSCSDKGIVNISIDSFQWLKCSQLVSCFNIANISGMPYFITFGKMIKKPWMYPSMSI